MGKCCQKVDAFMTASTSAGPEPAAEAEPESAAGKSANAAPPEEVSESQLGEAEPLCEPSFAVGLSASSGSAGSTDVAEGGRVVVLAYHSLEDRRVKRFFRDGKFRGDAERDAYGNRLTPFRPLTRKAETASDDEVAANPRARSARLRVAERTDWSPS